METLQFDARKSYIEPLFICILIPVHMLFGMAFPKASLFPLLFSISLFLIFNFFYKRHYQPKLIIDTTGIRIQHNMLSFLKLNSPLQWHENLQIARIDNATRDTPSNISSKFTFKLGLTEVLANSSFVIFGNHGNHLQQRFIINSLQWQIEDINGLENYFTNLGFAVNHMTSQAYTNDYFPPAKDMGKLAKNLTYSAFVLFILGLIGLFFDKLSTVEFGSIEQNLLIFTAISTAICLFSLRDINSTKPQLAMVSFVMWVGNIIVAGLFSSMLAFFMFSLSLLASNYVATEPMTFQFSEPTKATQKYDKWVSDERADFHVLCQLNPDKTITRKTVETYQFLGMTRIRTKDICLEN